jgi:TIR domain/Right handed beta helix region
MFHGAVGMADVFVSYKKEERAKVEAVVRALQALGLTVWYDYELVAGDQFHAKINDQIGRAKAVVVCWSKAAIESEWVQAEADRARAANKFVSVMVEPCEIPLPYNVSHWADLTTWTGSLPHDGFRRLVGGLAALVDPTLKQRYAELSASDQRKIDEQIRAQGGEDADELDDDTYAPAAAEYVVDAARSASEGAGSSSLAALISQALFEEEILRDERTKWVVAGGEGTPIKVPDQARVTRSLNEALEKAEEGDCVVVLPGTYRGRFTISKNLRLVGFSSMGERPVLTGADDSSYVLQVGGNARVENLEVESRQRGHAVLVASDGRPTIIRCVISRHQLVPHDWASFHAQTGSKPTLLACIITGNACPGVQFAGTAGGEVIASHIGARTTNAVVLSGSAKPRFDRCTITANDGHAVVSNSNAAGVFENCSLRATQSSAIVNDDQSFSKFVGNRVSVRRGALIQIQGFARGRFERNKLEPCPELKALAQTPPPRRPLFGPRPQPLRIPAPIEVSAQHRARFAENRLPDGTVAAPTTVH